MLTKIDSKLWLNLDHVVLLERDEGGVIVRFVAHGTDYIEGPAAAALIAALDARRRWLMRLDAWLRRMLGVRP